MINIILLCFLIISFYPSSATSKETLEFAEIANTPNQVIGGKILQFIYAKLNIKAKIIPLPGSRASFESNKGTLSGEVLRIYSYGEQFPNLIRIEPEIQYIQPTVFSKNENILINGWDSLSKYRIGIIRGFLWMENGVKNIQEVTRVNTIEQLASMVNLDRIDVFISDKLNGMLILKKMKLDKKIKPLSPPVSEKIKLYHYIHKKHKDLIPKIEKVVQEMTKSGELEALSNKFKKEMLEKDIK